MDDATTFDARIYQTEVYRGSEVTTYKVRPHRLPHQPGRLWHLQIDLAKANQLCAH